MASSAKPIIEIPEGSPPPGLTLDDIVEGTGATAIPGATVSVHYVGMSWSTGKEFDASWDRGEHFNFKLGVGQVIEGWDEGVTGMREGGQRRITIPPHLGYGEHGAGSAIAPHETLVFIVDLVSVH
jgi:peptidylprolyl isomerase